MNIGNPESKSPGTGQPDRFHRWRARRDLVARWVIAVGGIGVIGAVGLAPRAMERMGDRCENTAEYVFNLLHGRDIRHTSLDEVMEEIGMGRGQSKVPES